MEDDEKRNLKFYFIFIFSVCVIFSLLAEIESKNFTPFFGRIDHFLNEFFCSVKKRSGHFWQLGTETDVASLRNITHATSYVKWGHIKKVTLSQRAKIGKIMQWKIWVFESFPLLTPQHQPLFGVTIFEIFFKKMILAFEANSAVSLNCTFLNSILVRKL